MPHYVKIDPTATGPARILASYHGDIDYVGMGLLDPKEPGVFEISEEAWAKKNGRSHVLDGKLIDDPTPPIPALTGLMVRATQLLTETNTSVIMRCYEEAIPVPAAWKAYRTQLRAIASGADEEIPVQPPMPVFT